MASCTPLPYFTSSWNSSATDASVTDSLLVVIMPGINQKSVLSTLRVRDAMRRLVVHLPAEASIAQAIREMIKFKVNAVLVSREKIEALGVVSKTNILGAYYGGLPVDTPLTDVLAAPLVFCHPDDSLDAALDKMRTHNIHRLYVSEEDKPVQAAGVLAYTDIAGLLYRFCHKCPKSTLRSANSDASEKSPDYFRVGEVMITSVHGHLETDSLGTVMESLFTERVRTALIRNESGIPTGVVSTSDLMIAFLHGLSHDVQAKDIMSSPVRVCEQTEPLVTAIQRMVFADIQSLYVYKENPHNIIGMLSLSEIARIRSGSCRACLVSRIEIEESI